MTGERPLVGAFSVDVEEWFHAENVRTAAPPERWSELPSRVEGQVERLLDLLDAHETAATFFCLGWVAERRPALIRRIAERGHEVASHGHDHRMLGELGPDRFRDDLARSKAALQDASGVAVLGYRAPTWSIGPATDWAFDALVEAGYRYDSSVFPVRHDRYGDPSAPIVPHRVRRAGGSLVELPPLVRPLLGMNLPAAGGGYLRLLPFGWTRAAVARAVRSGRPVMLYVHPWEIDPDQPRVSLPLLRRWRHYAGLGRVEGRLGRLLAAHRLGRAIDLVEAFERREEEETGIPTATAAASSAASPGGPR